MLTVRIQAIDGVGTFTLLDSQPCRLLPTPPIGYAMWAGLLGTAEVCLRACTTSRRRNAVVVGRVLDYRKDIKHQRLTRVPTSGYPSSAHRFKMAWAATSRSAESTGCLSRSTNSSAIL